MIHVYKAGEPVPQPRPRTIRKGTRNITVSSASDRVKKYRAGVKQAIKAALAEAGGSPHACPGGVCVQLELFFQTDRAERHGQPHTSKPDLDNVAKLWLDVAQECGLLTQGDEAVAQLTIEKRWAASAGALLTVAPANPQESDDPDDLGA